MTQVIRSKFRTRILDQDGSKNYNPNNEFGKNKTNTHLLKKYVQHSVYHLLFVMYLKIEY
jgi:hypothetical protein